MDFTDFLSVSPYLASLEPESALLLKQSARIVTIPANTTVFRDGSTSENFIIVLEGAVRVQKVSENGREIVLYRVESNQSCVMTTACLLGGSNYAAEGISESEVKAAVVPSSTFRLLLAKSECFRTFIFASYANRMSDLFTLVEEIAFRRIDVRLAGWLTRRSDLRQIHATHQTIAAELGTSREVVSRQLKEFERLGWVTLQRGSIAISDGQALINLADRL